MLTWPKKLEGSITAVGEKGSVRVGAQNNVLMYDAVALEDDLFCGPCMVFTNVYNLCAAVGRKAACRRTLAERGATPGANCTMVCGITVGERAFVGAGAVCSATCPTSRSSSARRRAASAG